MAQEALDQPQIDALTDIATKIGPVAKQAADDIYERILLSVQDHLIDNAEFNIGSTLKAAERERRAQWERADRAEKVSAALLKALEAALVDLEAFEKPTGIPLASAEQARAAIALAGERS